MSASKSTATPEPATPAASPSAFLNALSTEAAREALHSCCGSARWVAGMLARRPFTSVDQLHAAAAEVWSGLGPADFLEAFAHHPRIGERADAARAATATSRAWSADEQARAASAADAETAELHALNQAYAARFGYIFIICASGKSAVEILAALRARLLHDPERELDVAAAEQAKITRLRLDKLAR